MPYGMLVDSRKSQLCIVYSSLYYIIFIILNELEEMKQNSSQDVFFQSNIF